MQSTLQHQTKERPHLPPKMPTGELCVVGHKIGYLAMPPRSRSACTCSNRPGSVRCACHGYVVPGEKLRKRHGSKEILRRALKPPPQRLGPQMVEFQANPKQAL